MVKKLQVKGAPEVGKVAEDKKSKKRKLESGKAKSADTDSVVTKSKDKDDKNTRHRMRKKRTRKMRREAKQRKAELEEKRFEKSKKKFGGENPREESQREVEEFPESRIFVSGIARDVQKQDIMNFFKKHGEVSKIRLVLNSHGTFRGVAFVCFKEANAAHKALKEDGVIFKGKELSVKKATPPLPKPSATVIYIGNLPLNADPKIVRKDFAECGLIRHFFFVRNSTGKFRGFAFAKYADSASVEKALGFNGTEYGGQKVVVRRSNNSCKGHADEGEDMRAKRKKGKKNATEGGDVASGKSSDKPSKKAKKEKKADK